MGLKRVEPCSLGPVSTCIHTYDCTIHSIFFRIDRRSKNDIPESITCLYAAFLVMGSCPIIPLDPWDRLAAMPTTVVRVISVNVTSDGTGRGTEGTDGNTPTLISSSEMVVTWVFERRGAYHMPCGDDATALSMRKPPQPTPW